MSTHSEFSRSSRVLRRLSGYVLRALRGVHNIPRTAWVLFTVSFMLRLTFLYLESQNFTSEYLWESFFPDTTVYTGVAEYFKSFSPEFEEYVLISGPGYGFIIYVLSFLVGSSAWTHLFVQVIISGLSSVLVRRLALQLDLKNPVATLAGYVHAFSLSAIYLSCSLLTETWYVFLSLLSLSMFFKAYSTGQTRHYLQFTFLSFATAMVRSIGLLHPLALVVLLALPFFRNRGDIRKTLGRPLVFASLSVILIMGWAARNYVKHDIFTVSETGLRAARTYWVASVAAREWTLGGVKEVREIWENEIANRYGADPTLREIHDFDRSVVRDSLSKYPGPLLRSYAHSVWENMTSKSYHQHVLATQWQPLWGELSRRILGGMGSYLVGATLFGLTALALSGRRRAAAFLLMFYLLYALTSGITFWQSSRIFFPAEPFWAISCAFMFFWILEKSKGFITRFRSRFCPAG